MSDGFLARWSRRKRDEARRPAEPPTAAPDCAPPVAVPADEDGSLSPDELARLPSLDALTAATDLAPFLRKGVPRALRNAALRRMWSLDPAIRDFASEAREYAYDWNSPGGVPGTGGAISAEDVRAMVEAVFGGSEEKTSAPSDEGEVADESAGLASLRGRGESFTPLAQGEASSEPQVRREGEGGSMREPPPDAPPHRRLPPRSVDHDVAGALSRPAGRGDALDPRELPPAGAGMSHRPLDRADPEPKPPPSPSRLRRHGGALPI